MDLREHLCGRGGDHAVPAGVLGKWRRLQQRLPLLIERTVDHRLGTDRAGAVFFVPRRDESIGQRDRRTGVRIGRLHQRRIGRLGHHARDAHPMTAGRDLLGRIHRMPLHVHHIRIAVPEGGDITLFVGERLPLLVNLNRLLEVGAALRRIEGQRRLGLVLACRVHHEGSKRLPVRLYRIHVRRRRRHPSSGGSRHAELRHAARLLESVLPGPRKDMLRHGVAIGNRSCIHIGRHPRLLEPVVHRRAERVHTLAREGELPPDGQERVRAGQ